MYLPKSPGITTLGRFHFQDFKTSLVCISIICYVHSFDTAHSGKIECIVLKSRILSSLVGQIIVVTTIFLSITLSVLPSPA